MSAPMYRVAMWNFIINTSIALVALYFYYGYMSHRPQYRYVKELRAKYDYIIVGGGSAGSVLAARLSENSSISVLLLEAGHSDVGHAEIDTPLLGPNLWYSQFDWMFFSEPQKHGCLGLEGKKAYFARGRVLGGSSSINYMQWARGHRKDFDKWAELGCEGWSYSDVLPYFKKSESIGPTHLAVNEKYHSTKGPMKITELQGYSLSSIFVAALNSLGYPVVDYNAEEQEGVAKTQANIFMGERWSASRGYLWPAAEQNNLDIITEAIVSKVEIVSGRTTEVHFERTTSSETERLSATVGKEVILSAGVFGSPQILMLSGVGPKEHLDEFEIPVQADLPVGNNLQDHLLYYAAVDTNVSVGMQPPSTLDQIQYSLFGSGPFSSPGANDGIAYMRTSNSLEQPDIQVVLVEGQIDARFCRYMPGFSTEILRSEFLQKSQGFALLPTAMQLKSRGTVRLKTRYFKDAPLIDPNYLSEESDLDELVRSIELVKSIVDTEAMQKVGAKLRQVKLHGCTNFKFDTEKYWRCFFKHSALTAHHQTSTCKMGAMNDKSAVVDPRLRVKGIKGLRVVDASVMPLVVSANTNAATIMIAEKAADMIKEDNL